MNKRVILRFPLMAITLGGGEGEKTLIMVEMLQVGRTSVLQQLPLSAAPQQRLRSSFKLGTLLVLEAI